MYFKSDPAIQIACQKKASTESFINLGWPQAKWIHDLTTWPKGDHDISYWHALEFWIHQKLWIHSRSVSGNIFFNLLAEKKWKLRL